MNPTLKVGVTKKLKKLYLSFDEDNVLELDIDKGEIDLILLDDWITNLLKAEWEKVNLRNQLSGQA